MGEKYININNLKPLACIHVKGQIEYSHITKPTSNEERQLINQYINHPLEQNFIMLIMKNTQIIRKANVLTMSEKYIEECIFGENNKLAIINPNREKTQIVVIKKDYLKENYKDHNSIITYDHYIRNNPYYDSVITTEEPASGLNITAVLNLTEDKTGNYIDLTAVMINEKLKYEKNPYDIEKIFKKNSNGLFICKYDAHKTE